MQTLLEWRPDLACVGASFPRGGEGKADKWMLGETRSIEEGPVESAFSIAEGLQPTEDR